MAIKRKPATKPALKPAARPTPKPLPRSKPAPLDLVRNPNFNAAMAQQEYQNLVRQQSADIRARISAEQNAAEALGVKYIATMGTSKPMQTEGNQDFIDSRDPNKKYTQDMVDYIDPTTGEKTSRTRGVVPAPGSRFVPANQAGLINELQRNQNPIGGQQSTNSTAGYAQVDPMTGMQGNQSIYDSLRDYQARTYPVPMGGNPAGIGQQFGQIAQGIGRLMPQNPQSQQQQMQNYQNFLQQGIQNSNTLNQGAMNNFSNMQPGMQATQTASRTTPNQTMPVAGMGMQQPKQTQPRKFSTVRNTPARFA
jgi:hypothetical protein